MARATRWRSRCSEAGGTARPDWAGVEASFAETPNVSVTEMKLLPRSLAYVSADLEPEPSWSRTADRGFGFQVSGEPVRHHCAVMIM